MTALMIADAFHSGTAALNIDGFRDLEDWELDVVGGAIAPFVGAAAWGGFAGVVGSVALDVASGRSIDWGDAFSAGVFGAVGGVYGFGLAAAGAGKLGQTLGAAWGGSIAGGGMGTLYSIYAKKR
ncbi:MAG: hypothetical protein ACK5SX_15565 [Sandaracinobacter sp.]